VRGLPVIGREKQVKHSEGPIGIKLRGHDK
jgi:hypothetical protein